MSFFDETLDWVGRTTNIESAVLFGSTASKTLSIGKPGSLPLSDLDLQLVVNKYFIPEQVNWSSAIPSSIYCFQASRAASGGVRKFTVIFSSGQIDMVVVPLSRMRIASMGLRLGLYNRISGLRVALDEIATCLHSGYCFLKGRPRWQHFYNRVFTLSGVRLSNNEILNLADTLVCDVLWVFQKLENGELIAAQHVLHTKLSETNLRLWRELRRRRNLPLQSFGLGRRVEMIAPEMERMSLSVSARLEDAELRRATLKALESLKSLMIQLQPEWCVSTAMDALYTQYR